MYALAIYSPPKRKKNIHTDSIEDYNEDYLIFPSRLQLFFFAQRNGVKIFAFLKFIIIIS